MTANEIKKELHRLQALLEVEENKEEAQAAANKKAELVDWELRTNHTVGSMGDSDHCISEDGERWIFLVVPPNTPAITRVFESRDTTVIFANGEEIEIPEEWGCGETAQEAWASANLG
jgi:hypothetical protein